VSPCGVIATPHMRILRIEAGQSQGLERKIISYIGRMTAIYDQALTGAGVSLLSQENFVAALRGGKVDANLCQHLTRALDTPYGLEDGKP
jgi:hypothetical protein